MQLPLPGSASEASGGGGGHLRVILRERRREREKNEGYKGGGKVPCETAILAIRQVRRGFCEKSQERKKRGEHNTPARGNLKIIIRVRENRTSRRKETFYFIVKKKYVKKN